MHLILNRSDAHRLRSRRPAVVAPPRRHATRRFGPWRLGRHDRVVNVLRLVDAASVLAVCRLGGQGLLAFLAWGWECESNREGMKMNEPTFSQSEYDRRLCRVREAMEQQGLDALLLAQPESIFYLVGLDHQGFFAYHMLVVPREGEMVLITRAMEAVTVAAQVTRARFVGYEEDDDPAEVTRRALGELGLASGRVAIEKECVSFPPRIYEDIVLRSPGISWLDGSHIVQRLRMIKSAEEIAYVREAARVSDLMMETALQTASVGVNERDVAAEVHRAMILGGGGNPGFGPFIRTTDRLNQEHTTWHNRQLVPGDALFLELSACVNRYHAPLGRLVFIGRTPAPTSRIAQICLEAFHRMTEAVQPGVTAAEVYQAWQGHIRAAGLADYRRHHCGYIVGLGFPPSWTGGNRVMGLRADSPRVLEPGMAFHLMSWLMGSEHGDFFVSNTAVLGKNGCEVLTRAPVPVSTT